jgi:hypothetical protein
MPKLTPENVRISRFALKKNKLSGQKKRHITTKHVWTSFLGLDFVNSSNERPDHRVAYVPPLHLGNHVVVGLKSGDE